MTDPFDEGIVVERTDSFPPDDFPQTEITVERVESVPSSNTLSFEQLAQALARVGTSANQAGEAFRAVREAFQPSATSAVRSSFELWEDTEEEDTGEEPKPKRLTRRRRFG